MKLEPSQRESGPARDWVPPVESVAAHTSPFSSRPARRADAHERVGPVELWIAASLFAATLALRLVYAYHYRFDSDEPQHLHVVWAWTRGLLPYRDLFDNHAPLFHLLCAPLLSIVGERADALYLMRLAMIPMYAVVLGCVYALGRSLFDARTALWAALLAGLWPQDFLTSVEFRTDDLWTAFWMLGVATLSCGRWTRTRSLLAGLLIGAAFGVSMKTTLLLAALAGAALVMATLGRRDAPAGASDADLEGTGGSLVRSLLFVAGLVLTPGLLAAYFAKRGALADAIYCTIDHNILPGLGLWRRLSTRALLFPGSLPILWLGGQAILRTGASPEVARRRTFVFLAAGHYLVTLLGFWPLITPQDFLPFIPLAVLLGAGLLLVVPPWIRAKRRRLAWAPALAVSIGGELAAIAFDAPPWANATRRQTRVVSNVLRLTTPTEYVMDLKGEAVFRQRPFYWALEGITIERIRRGMILDRIPERLIETHTAVVADDSSRLPPRAREFMNANYVPVSGVRVLGHFLGACDASGSRRIRFVVAIPDRYALVTPTGPARGSLDDERYAGPRYLVHGSHVFQGVPGQGHLALVWARALERGFSPFSSSQP